MRKTLVIIFYFALVAFTVLTTAQILGYLGISPQTEKTYFLSYALSVLFVSTFYFIVILALENRKPKTEVKIVYKTVDKTKEKQTEQKQTEQKINKIVSAAVEGLDKINDFNSFSEKLFNNFSETFDIVQGLFFLWNEEKKVYYTAGTYAFYTEDNYKEFELGQGITGQVAKDKRFLYIDNVPEGYITILSGLGKGSPNYLTFLPIVSNDRTIAVIEFATFSPLPEPVEEIFKKIAQKLSPLVEKFLK